MKGENTGTGLSFLSLLGIVFITLKLTDVIDWSWWWVTLPLWGGLAFGLVAIVMIAIVGVIAALIDKI